MLDTLKNHTAKFILRHGGDKLSRGNVEAAKYFLQSTDSLEHGLRLMIEGFDMYVQQYKPRTGWPVGEDGYTGKYMEDIANALSMLLSAPGTFDGGTLSRVIGQICDNGKIEIE